MLRTKAWTSASAVMYCRSMCFFNAIVADAGKSNEMRTPPTAYFIAPDVYFIDTMLSWKCWKLEVEISTLWPAVTKWALQCGHPVQNVPSKFHVFIRSPNRGTASISPPSKTELQVRM